jgi:hypothetical protein
MVLNSENRRFQVLIFGFVVLFFGGYIFFVTQSDEFANIGQIPDFDKLLATMRSREISANIIVQNIAQLKAMYKDTWEVITGNCDSFLFLGGKEESTLKMVSNLLGKETIDIQTQNRSKGRQGSTSENNSLHGRELMTADELAKMPINDCVLFVRAFNPFYSKKIDTFSRKNYKQTGDFDSKNNFDTESIVTEKMPESKFDEKDYIVKSDDMGIPISKQIDVPEDGYEDGEEGEVITENEIETKGKGGGNEMETITPAEQWGENVSSMNELEGEELNEAIQSIISGEAEILDTSEALCIEADDVLLTDEDVDNLASNAEI